MIIGATDSIRTRNIIGTSTPYFPLSFRTVSGSVRCRNIGKAVVRCEGRDIALVTFFTMMHKALEAAELLRKEGVLCEVIDLRIILPCDYDTIMASLYKRHRLVAVQEANLRGDFASDLVAEAVERGFDLLDAPPARISVFNVPMPYDIGSENASFQTRRLSSPT